jgi:hypothetical protein
MERDIISVPQRLEHIEQIGQETRSLLLEVLGSVGVLTERSKAHTKVLSDMRQEIRLVHERQNLQALELAKLPHVERDIDTLHERVRLLDARVIEVEKRDVRSTMIESAGTKLAGHVVTLIFALMLAGILWLLAIKDQIGGGAP